MESRSRRVRADLQAHSGRFKKWLSLTVGTALALVGCSGDSTPRGLHHAVNASAQEPLVPPPPPPAPDLPWDLAAELAGLRPVGEKSRSQHLSGDLEGEVLANAAAGPYPRLGPARSVERGAILVQALRNPGDSAVKAYFAMRKREQGYDPAGADWEYAVTTSSGAFELRGRIAGCGRCHAEAPQDHLFGADRR